VSVGEWLIQGRRLRDLNVKPAVGSRGGAAVESSLPKNRCLGAEANIASNSAHIVKFHAFLAAKEGKGTA